MGENVFDVGRVMKDTLASSPDGRVKVYKFSVPDETERNMKEANAVILVCCENMTSLLDNNETVTLANGSGVSCEFLKRFIESKEWKEKVIPCACNENHIPEALKSNNSHIYQEGDFKRNDFSRRVRPFIEAL